MSGAGKRILAAAMEIREWLAGRFSEEPVEIQKKVYAKRGERVTCENGHYICTIAEDVYGAELKAEDWQQPEPEPDSRPVCNVCGAKWWHYEKGDLWGQFLHIDGEWR